jgi:hypothetical protein
LQSRIIYSFCSFITSFIFAYRDDCGGWKSLFKSDAALMQWKVAHSSAWQVALAEPTSSLHLSLSVHPSTFASKMAPKLSLYASLLGPSAEPPEESPARKDEEAVETSKKPINAGTNTP